MKDYQSEEKSCYFRNNSNSSLKNGEFSFGQYVLCQ